MLTNKLVHSFHDIRNLVELTYPMPSTSQGQGSTMPINANRQQGAMCNPPGTT